MVGAKASFLSVKLGPEKELREQPLSLRVIVLLLMAGLESILIISKGQWRESVGLFLKGKQRTIMNRATCALFVRSGHAQINVQAATNKP